MRLSALPFQKTESALSLADIERNAEGWLLDGEIRQHSDTTLANRRLILDKLLWFLRDRSYPTCGLPELRQFLAYIGRGNDQGGRWGNARVTNAALPSTVQTYHRHLRTFFRWMIAEGILESSPMEAIATPVARPDQVQPFTQAQVNALLQCAKKSQFPRRNEAILLFLLDTGLRASEFCALRLKDADIQGRRCTVTGKGNKKRTVPFGGTAAKALWQYLREDPREPEDPLFFNKRGDALTRSGLRQLLEQFGEEAGIEATRCSPHTMRHTFAVEFLRAGGNVFTLQQILGHTTLSMTNRYVALAQADIEAQHRQFSPADRLKKGRK